MSKLSSILCKSKNVNGAPTPGRLASSSGRRSFTVELSFSGLISVVIVAIIGLGWVFAFGVIVGRGYSPEAELPELARLVPTPGNAQVRSEHDILSKEELTFLSDLKQAPGHAITSSRPREATSDGAVSSQAPAPTPAGTAPVATNQIEQPAAATTTLREKPEPVLQQPEALFDFVIQVVAYKNSAQADALRERLEGKGMRTRLAFERDGKGNVKWYRVQVLLRGTDVNMEGTKQQLVKLGIKDAMVASKKPAGRR